MIKENKLNNILSNGLKKSFLNCLGIHQPVTAFTKHLAPKVHDLFKNSLTPNAPIWRANWAVFNDLEGPLDLFTPDGHDKRNEANKTNDYQGISKLDVLLWGTFI